MRQQNYKIILTVTLGFLLSFSAASAKNFNIFNAATPSQSYFTVNGTSGNVGIGMTNPTSLLQLLNNGWISAQNAAGTGVVNMFKVNASDQIEVGAPLNIGSFEFSPDSGLVSFVDMPVTSAAASGTPEGYAFKVDGDNIFTAYAESNGTGGIQNKRLGIGLTNPTAALDVAGSLRNTLATTHSLLGGSGEVLVMADNSGNLYATSTTGFLGGGSDLWGGTTTGKIWNANYGYNIGLGTTNPFRKLDINQPVDGTQLQVRNNGASTLSQSAGIQFSIGDSGVTTDEYAKGALFFKGDGSDWGRGDFIFALDNVADAGNASTSDAKMVIRKDGNVGIGVTNPATKLHVSSTNVDPFLPIANFLAPSNTTVGNNTQIRLGVSDTTNNAAEFRFNYQGSNNANTYVGFGWDGQSSSVMSYNVAGNVGIGVTNPASFLHIYKNNATEHNMLILQNASSWTTGQGHDIAWRDWSATTGAIGFTYSTTTDTADFRIHSQYNGAWTNSTTVNFIVKGNGNVGIGITNPSTKLYVAGTSLNTLATTHSLLGGAGNVVVMADNTGALYATSTASLLSGGSSLWSGTLDGNIWNGTAGAGNVGIGTTAPGAKLQIFTNTVGMQDVLNIKNGAGGNQINGENIILSGYYNHAVISAFSNPNNGYGGTLQFQTNDASNNLNTGIVLNAVGNVGIGITNPGSYKLNVNGSINSLSGGISFTQDSGYANLTGSSYTDTGWAGTRIAFNRARGTQSASTAVVNGDVIGWFDYYAHDGTTHVRAGQFGLAVDGTVSTGIVPGKFYVRTANSAGSNIERTTWYANDNISMANNGGNVGIGIVSPTAKLYVAGTSLNTLATTHSLLGGAGNVLVMADNTGALYATSTAGFSGGTNFWGGTKNGTIWNGDAGAGNVGIGTTNPLGIFEANLNAGDAILRVSDSTTTDKYNLGVGGYSRRITLSSEQGSFRQAMVLSDAGVNTNTIWGIGVSSDSGVNWSPILTAQHGGNIGIGTSNPTAPLDLVGSTTAGALIFAIGGNDLAGDALKVTSTGPSGTTYTAGSSAVLNVGGRGTTPSIRTRGGAIFSESYGNVGIGTTTPGTKLDIIGTVRNTLATTHSLLGGGGDVLVMADNSGNLYATSTAGFIGGSGSYLPLTGGSLTGNLNMGGNNILNINKLTVNTIDPLYNIQGVNYSTFASAIAGGVKEEYLGRAKISNLNSDGEREYVIDFNDQPIGSDLWVWRKTVDFSADNVEVLITPYGNFAQVYYKIEDNKIIFRADKSAEVSYRLSGRRLDWKEWPTKANDQTEKAGFVIE